VISSLLLCFIPCRRGQVSSVDMTLYHNLWWILSVLSKALDVHARVQRWKWLVKLSVRVRPILFPGEVLGHVVSACTSSDDRTTRPQDRGKVVLLYAASPSQIRDGPMRRRPRLGGLLQNDHREAA
jgi:hypothetical protein